MITVIRKRMSLSSDWVSVFSFPLRAHWTLNTLGPVCQVDMFQTVPDTSSYVKVRHHRLFNQVMLEGQSGLFSFLLQILCNINNPKKREKKVGFPVSGGHVMNLTCYLHLKLLKLSLYIYSSWRSYINIIATLNDITITCVVLPAWHICVGPPCTLTLLMKHGCVVICANID